MVQGPTSRYDTQVVHSMKRARRLFDPKVKHKLLFERGTTVIKDQYRNAESASVVCQ